jgi:hypothetical protein
MNDVRMAFIGKRLENGRVNAARAGNATQGLIVWHRRLGIAVALIVLLLAVTGLLLNHTHRLGLDNTHVTASWLLRWYGYPPVEMVSHRVGERWITWTGRRLYLQDKPVMETDGAPVGAVAAGNRVIVVAFPDLLVLLDPDGKIMERLGRESLPGGLRRIGASGERIVAATAAGQAVADADLVTWQPSQAAARWSTPQEAPAALRERLLSAERGPGLSAERVLQDVHSGRIFGRWGPWVMDAAAILFVILAVTGITCWWARRARTTPRRSGDGRGRE